MTALEVPSKSFSSIGGTEVGEMLQCFTNLGSAKQWVEPESTSADIVGKETEAAGDVRERRREFGSERADALRRNTS
jgi:hypothetical protein